MSRRAFLSGGLGAGAALLALPRLARGQRFRPVRLALLGCGQRGTALAAAAAAAGGVDVVTAVDAYSGRRARARELLGDELAVGSDARAAIERSDVDGVVIATPDHLHLPLLRHAAAAGKDVYCESPLSHARDATADLEAELAGRVMLCSAGRAGSPLVERARQLVEEGRLGKVRFASGSWLTSGALDAWLYPYPPDSGPETIDFAAFQGPAAHREFDVARFFRWQRYWDYGAGLAGQRFAPLLSALDRVLGCGAPRRAQALGGVHRWLDGREVPDTLLAGLEYGSGLSVSLSASQGGGAGERLLIVGTDASLVLEPGELRLIPDPELEPYPELGETWPEQYRSWFYMMHSMTPDGRPRRGPEARVAEQRFRLDTAADPEPGLSEFVSCVRSRQPPREGLRHALDVAAAVHLVKRAYRESAAVAAGRAPRTVELVELGVA